MRPVFLSAEWRKLILANYVVDPALLKPFLPHKTEMDQWQGCCYLSLVGFRFVNTRLKGFRVPFHTNFEEVNLRFYVKRREAGIWKRGGVFIKELVPRPALTWVANMVYREHYETVPMRHLWTVDDTRQQILYRWKKGKRWHSMEVEAAATPAETTEGSAAAFITEHYWGYARAGALRTTEYEVMHPRWQIAEVYRYGVDVDFGLTYGTRFSFLKGAQPASVFLAEGSGIEVRAKRTL